MPSGDPARSDRRRNGSKSDGTSSAGISGPPLATSMNAMPARVPVATWTQPSGTLCRIALSIRLVTSRSTRTGSPRAGAGSQRRLHA